jgi:hypothetical protein
MYKAYNRKKMYIATADTRGGAMKRITASMLCLLFAVAVAHGAQVGKKDAFWDMMQNKLVKVAPVKKQSTQGIPGGVRGAKNDDANDIYWKGKDKTVEMTDEEMQKFSLAMETKLKGDNEQALKLFEEFLVMYPQSSFRLEGMQATEKIRTEIAATKNSPVQTAPVVQAVPSETPQGVNQEPVAPSAGAQAPAPVDAVPVPAK